MKKLLSIILVTVIAVSFAACTGKKTEDAVSEPSSSDTSNAGDPSVYTTQAAAYQSTGKSSGKSFETVLDTNEYAMYYNIFYNDMGGDYADKPVFKKGTFATLYDEYNKVTRYYVWGYNDQTKCCDWQWELKIDDTSNLPSNGSLIEVSGTFVKDDASLDGYWITDADITVKKEYKGPDVDIDMSTMSATLERVQAFYITNSATYTGMEGKTVCMYGRVKTDSSIQHPYYNDAYEVGVETSDTMPAIGMMVLVTGTVQNCKVVNASVSITEDY